MGLALPLLLQLALPLDLHAGTAEQTIVELSQRVRERDQAEDLLDLKLTMDGLGIVRAPPFFSFQNVPPLSSGGSLLLVHLWSVHCPPCLKEMPVLGELFKRLQASTSIKVVMLTEDSLDTLEQYLNRAPDSLPKVPLYAAGPNSHLRAGIQHAPLPITLLLDHHQIIRRAFVGPIVNRRNDLLTAVDRLCSSLGSACRKTQ